MLQYQLRLDVWHYTPTFLTTLEGCKPWVTLQGPLGIYYGLLRSDKLSMELTNFGYVMGFTNHNGMVINQAEHSLKINLGR